MSEYHHNIGEILTVNRDMNIILALSEDTVEVKKGTKVIVGADGFVHYMDGHIQRFSENDDVKVSGYDAEGLSQWISKALENELPMEEMLEGYDLCMADVESIITDVLQELGFWPERG